MRTIRPVLRGGLPLAALLLWSIGGCGRDRSPTSAAPPGETVLLDVVPAGGATGVDPAGPVTVTFNHPMNPEMSDYVDVHQGDVSGPVVGGSWSWSEDYTVLSFTPDEPLQPATTYVIHLGGGLRDSWDRPVDCAAHGPEMGGRWMWGMMGGGGPGGGAWGYHMGAGWQGADGDSGMAFTFTTAG